MSDERTVVRCTVPFAIVRHEESTILKTQQQLDAGRFDIVISIRQVHIRHIPAYMESVGVGFTVEGAGNMETGYDRHGAFSYSEVEVITQGNVWDKPHLEGNVVQWLNDVARMKAIEYSVVSHR